MSIPLAAAPDTFKNAESAFEWLLNSGIQDVSAREDKRGGVNAWFDLRTQSYPFLYAEITGYAVNAYLYARSHLKTREDAYLKAARDAADWLIRQQFSQSGLVRTRVNHDHFQVAYFEDWVFTFDQWIILYGLACLGETSGEKSYAEHACRMADFLLSRTVRQDGLFYPVYHVGRDEPEATGDKWSRQSGGFHGKALMALDKLYQMTGKKAYADAAERLAASVLRLQQSSGRFITQDSEGSTHLHPHLYTIEGLLQHGLFNEAAEVLSAARRGVEWVLDGQHPDGRIDSFYKNDAFQPFTRVDVLAQTLRAASILKRHQALPGRDEALRRLREKLLSFQVVSGPHKGGFFYGQEQDGTIHFHLNAWVTMFAAQALWLSASDEPLPKSCVPFFI